MPYWTFPRDSDVSDRAAALFAQSSRLIASYDVAQSTALIDAAKKAYAWAESDTVRPPSPQAKIAALSALFRATGDLSYKSAFDALFVSEFHRDWDHNGVTSNDGLSCLSNRLPAGAEWSYPQSQISCNAFVDYALSPGADTAIADLIKTEIARKAKEALSTLAMEGSHAHRNMRGGYSPDWGNGSALAQIFASSVFPQLQLGNMTLSQLEDYIDAMSLNVDHMFGGNPAGMVWTTGLGSRSFQEPLHLDSLAFIKDKGLPPVPGIPVFGPVVNPPAASYYQPSLSMFYPAFGSQPVMYRFSDTRSFVTSSEFTVRGTMAPNILLLATLLPPNMMPPDCWKPGQTQHKNTLPVPCVTAGIAP